MVTVRPGRPEDAQACVDVLASSPDFFTREAHDEARTGVANSRPGPAAEITYAAVRPERRGAGVGSRLVRRALADLAGDGVALVEVKTLDASAGYEPYEATRAFWGASRPPPSSPPRPAISRTDRSVSCDGRGRGPRSG
jgi:GNAT superfamily N-acetyltransferase